MFVHAVPEFMLKKLLTRLGGMRRHSHVILALFLEFLVAGFTSARKTAMQLISLTFTVPFGCRRTFSTCFEQPVTRSSPLCNVTCDDSERLVNLAHGFCCVASLFCFSIT